MKNNFFNRLMIIALFCFVMPICGMEKSKSEILEFWVSPDRPPLLRYMSEELVKKTGTLLGIDCPQNMPFLRLTTELCTNFGKRRVTWVENTGLTKTEWIDHPGLSGYEPQEESLFGDCNYVPNGLGNIRDLPLCVFMDSNNKRKQKGDIFLTISHGEQLVNFKLRCEFGEDGIKTLLQNFQKQPIDDISLKNELLKNKIIEEHDGKIIHGCQGYFNQQKNSKTFFVGKKTMIASIMLLLVAAYACYKNPVMFQSFFGDGIA